MKRPAEGKWIVLFKADGNEEIRVWIFDTKEEAEARYEQIVPNWTEVLLCRIEKCPVNDLFHGGF